MAQRAFTFQDLAADFKLTLHDLATGVTLDANNKIASIANSFGNGANPATTANTNSARRHSLVTYGGLPCAFSDSTNYDGIVVSDISAFPKGDADRYMMVINLSQDGIVFGYRGSGTPYCVDNPFNPGYRLYSSGATLTGNVAPSANSLHLLEIIHKSSVSRMYVDAVLNGTLNGVQNTTATRFGIKGGEVDYYTMKGYTALCLTGKRAPTDDEMARIQWKAFQLMGRTLPSDHTYANSTPMVDDGGDSVTPITGTTSKTLGAATVVSTGSLSLSGSTNKTLQPLSSVSNGSLQLIGYGGGTLSPMTVMSVGELSIEGRAANTFQDLTANAFGGSEIGGQASATLEPIGINATGELTIAGKLSVKLSGLTAASVGNIEPQGEKGKLNKRLSPLTSISTGSLLLDGRMSKQLGRLTVNAVGDLGDMPDPAVEARLSVMLERLSIKATGVKIKYVFKPNTGVRNPFSNYGRYYS